MLLKAFLMACKEVFYWCAAAGALIALVSAIGWILKVFGVPGALVLMVVFLLALFTVGNYMTAKAKAKRG